MQALGGAKNHMVVMPDAVIEKTVDGIIGSAFGAAGQRCMAGSVVVTVGDAHEQLMPAADRSHPGAAGRRRARGVSRRRSGDLVRRARPHPRLDRARRGRRREARRRRARGRGSARGRVVRRTDDPRRRHADMDIAQEEVFGPVLAVIRAASLDEAIEIVNSSRFGNGTLDLHRVRRLGAALPPRGSGRDDRRQHRRRRAGRVLPVLGLEGLASSATCTPTAPTPSSSTRARRP